MWFVASVAIRSGRPSPSTSAQASADGCRPVANSVGDARSPVPMPFHERDRDVRLGVAIEVGNGQDPRERRLEQQRRWKVRVVVRRAPPLVSLHERAVARSEPGLDDEHLVHREHARGHEVGHAVPVQICHGDVVSEIAGQRGLERRLERAVAVPAKHTQRVTGGHHVEEVIAIDVADHDRVVGGPIIERDRRGEAPASGAELDRHAAHHAGAGRDDVDVAVAVEVGQGDRADERSREPVSGREVALAIPEHDLHRGSVALRERDRDVQIAIAIDVRDHRRERPAAVDHHRLSGLKRAIPVAEPDVEHRLRAAITGDALERDQEIRLAVAVDVRHRDSGRQARRGDPRRRRGRARHRHAATVDRGVERNIARSVDRRVGRTVRRSADRRIGPVGVRAAARHERQQQHHTTRRPHAGMLPGRCHAPADAAPQPRWPCIAAHGKTSHRGVARGLGSPGVPSALAVVRERPTRARSTRAGRPRASRHVAIQSESCVTQRNKHSMTRSRMCSGSVGRILMRVCTSIDQTNSV
jgi:hypothetical protein